MTATALCDTPREAARLAADAMDWLAERSPRERGELLLAVAGALDGAAAELIALADEETALGEARLTGEMARTTGQLRLFANVLAEGSYLEATLDAADPDATPPRPDLRRMLEPLGPVAVFAASNFPFAFSVAGGDTASALAAGCPVVLKAHSGHPKLSERTTAVVSAALEHGGAPAGTFSCLAGRGAGRELVRDPDIRAVGFTGSLAGGRALFDLAAAREDPIPFFGELGSINPVLITRRAVRERGTAIAEGLVGSFTLGVGQFCTKPGIVLVPDDTGFEQLVVDALAGATGGRMLTDRIAGGFHGGVGELLATGSARLLDGSGGHVDTATRHADPVLLAADAADLIRDPEPLLRENFGPACALVRYRDGDELAAAVDVLPGSLTTTVHAEQADVTALTGVVALKARSGRLVWNGWPTGVAVTWSQHHGGPWPATTAPLHTSVGATAIRRWLRPVCYQDYPAELLPPALRDDNPLGLPRRVNSLRTTTQSTRDG
ncbi:MAG: aldehyde dehydrogenase family protein [Actinophytocola sp.]|nr:aldehyde dehydrogenase family protein [Actinophytocola sp.]